MKEYYSYSKLSSVKCPRYHKYVYIDDVFPIEKPVPFVAGGIWHECVHMYFNGVKKKKILKHVSTSIKKFTSRIRSRKDYIQDLLIVEGYTRAALRGYFKLYDRKEFKVISTEMKFKIPFIKGVILGGVIDRVVKDKHNDVWLVEHKFTSQINKGYVVRTAIDQQVSIYFLAAQKMGLKPAGIIYDMAMKPYKKPLQDEASLDYEERMAQDYKLRPEFYYKREELERDKYQIKDLTSDIIKRIKRIRHMYEHNLFDKDTANCGTWGLCEYFPLCSNPKSSRNKILFKQGGRE